MPQYRLNRLKAIDELVEQQRATSTPEQLAALRRGLSKMHDDIVREHYEDVMKKTAPMSELIEYTPSFAPIG